MIKEDIINAVSEDTGYNRGIVSAVIESMLTNIAFALSEGDMVRFTGFGTFEPKSRAARTGKNPHTGEKVPIPARVMPVFTPGVNLKNAVIKNYKG